MRAPISIQALLPGLLAVLLCGLARRRRRRPHLGADRLRLRGDEGRGADRAHRRARAAGAAQRRGTPLHHRRGQAARRPRGAASKGPVPARWAPAGEGLRRLRTRPSTAAQLFRCRHRSRPAQSGPDGWIYAVGGRRGTGGAADPAGPFAKGRLKSGAAVVWRWCAASTDPEGDCGDELAITSVLQQDIARADGLLQIVVTVRLRSGAGGETNGALSAPPAGTTVALRQPGGQACPIRGPRARELAVSCAAQPLPCGGVRRDRPRWGRASRAAVEGRYNALVPLGRRPRVGSRSPPPRRSRLLAGGLGGGSRPMPCCCA